MPITIRKIELFCSLLFFSPTSLQRAKNACFSLIFSENSAFRNGFELRRSDVKKDFFFNIFRRRSNHLPTTSAFFRQIPSVSIYTKKLEINLTAMSRGFESHRLRHRQHPAGCCFLFLRQTMQGLQGGIRTARARRFASRQAATVLRTVARARENPTVCAKYHYSIPHWGVILYCRFVKFPYFSYKHLPFIFK